MVLCVNVVFLQDQETRIYILSMYETHARDLLCEVSTEYVVGCILWLLT